MIGMPSAFALGIFSGKFILYFRDSGTPAGVPLSHFHGWGFVDFLSSFCENAFGAARRPRQTRNKNKFSAIYAQSVSGGHFNGFP